MAKLGTSMSFNLNISLNIWWFLLKIGKFVAEGLRFKMSEKLCWLELLEYQESLQYFNKHSKIRM